MTHPLYKHELCTDSKQKSPFYEPTHSSAYMIEWSPTYPPLLVNVIRNIYTFNVLKEEAQNCQKSYEY